MSIIPTYTPPDFTSAKLTNAPAVKTAPAPRHGVAPDNFHGTSNHPEYLHLGEGKWLLVAESRMDAVLVLWGEKVEAIEARHLRKGDPVVVGRTEDGEEGIYVHTGGFALPCAGGEEKFTFRTRDTRETPFSRSYDHLYRILRYDRKVGHIVWVLGPAVAFDKDSRDAMRGIIEAGYCHALLAGNALATHDLEAALFGTGLGQDIYTQDLVPHGHNNHLEIINRVRGCGSIPAAVAALGLKDGIICACEEKGIPYVLAGSIRDDGPLPEVITDVCEAQDAMRVHARKATTVIAVATQLHSIAFGNMVPGYKVLETGDVRPVFFHIVDMSEFSADKLANRGSWQATAILTNAQDFMVNLWHNLREKPAEEGEEGTCGERSS
jgi:lysine-ketoglutarate reductase/saccharopine dehydrogenase-like protein (TIGR00300 family)